MMEPIVVEVQVAVTPTAAFQGFVRELGEWWPREYTWSGAVLQDIAIEPLPGGHCYEIGPWDFRCDWGRVLRYDPGRSIAFSWQIGPTRAPEPDPARASEVEVGFAPGAAGTTTVRLEHRGFDRHGEGAAGYRAAMASERGWPYILGRFVDHVGGRNRGGGTRRTSGGS